MRLTFLFLLFPFITQAQKWVGLNDAATSIDRKQAHVVQTKAVLSSDTANIMDFLFNKIGNLKQDQVGLILENFVISPKAKHYRFSQTIDGRKIFRGSIKINLANDGRVLSLFDHTFSIADNVEDAFPDHTPFHDGLMVHYNTDFNKNKLHHYNLEEVYFEQDGELIPAIRLEVVENTDRYYELVLNSDVKVIYQNDLLSYSAPPETDSTATLWVFNPDPLTTANESYGSPYSDSFDQDVLELNAERVAVQTSVTFENDTFFLRNNYASIEEFSLPNSDLSFSLTPEFNYTREEDGFEDANAFYHISYFQVYIQSLGFTNIANYAVAIDAHALNGSDNSNFNPAFNPPRLSFGEGGVDDAEDADVIIHEYGHAIMHSAAPGTNNGTERKTLDEAIGDYFASSYSRFLSNFGWSNVFSWDGHNEFWNGRSSISTDHYPEDLNNNIYSDADIWSATLMQIWEDIGRETTDAIMLQAAYSFSDGMSMTDAAMLFLQADTLLFGGANFTPIRQRMFDRGLIPWDVGINENLTMQQHFRVFNSGGFADGNGSVKIISDRSFTINLYNTIGQLLLTETAKSGTFELSGDGLDAGVYLLKVENDKEQQTFKLVKH